MKKITLLFAFLFAIFALNAQIFVAADFSDNTMPPSGWNIDGYVNQWDVSNSANAGGTAPEGKFTYTDADDITRFISPNVDLTGFTSVSLSFKHFYDDYDGTGPKLGVATRSGGGGWNTVWEIDPTSDVGPESLNIIIDNVDIGAADFEFCFYIEGNFYNLDYWYVDDIELFSPFALDCKMVTVTTASPIVGPTAIEGLIVNKGLNQITSVDVNWQVGNDAIFTTTFNGLNLASGETYNFVCDDLFDYPIGSHMVDIWVTNVNGGPDDDPSNDLFMKVINVASFSEQRVPCFEEFTSSTCGPCVTFNTPFVPWAEDHSDDITLVKYQMNWPGNGDPYYTAEGGQRRGYYNVSWVPWWVGDGMFKDTDMGVVNSFYTESMATPAFAAIASSFSLSGTNMIITTSVLPFAGFNNAMIQIIVFENETTENTGTNGETEFHHVMMKMVPDANGTLTDFVDRESVTLEHSVDLGGTNVEEWDDLGVIVIVQDLITGSVYQSGYAVENADFSTNADLSDLNVFGELIPGFDPDKLDYYTQLDEGTSEAPQITATSSDENAIVVIVPPSELPGTTIIDVFAEELSTFKRYSVHFSIVASVEDRLAETVKLYPNPNAGLLNISGFKIADINIYSSTGSLLQEYKDFNNNTIDISNLPNGIYFVNIQTDGDVVTKRITLYH